MFPVYLTPVRPPFLDFGKMAVFQWYWFNLLTPRLPRIIISVATTSLTSASYVEIYYTILSAFVDIWYYIIETQITAMGERHLKSLEACTDRGNYWEVYVNALSKISRNVKLGCVRSCLAIGPNEGRCEIEFLKHCEANISKFIGIEPDHASAEHLRTSLRSSLPGVESQVFESKIQNWEGPGEPVDLIMIFQVFYYIEAGERQELLKKVYDSWLVSGGYVATLALSDNKCAICTIYQNLGYTNPSWEEIEADFLKAGFTKHCEQKIHERVDYTDPSEDLLPFFQSHFEDRVITLAELREAVKGLPSEGKVDEFHTLAVFRSTN